MQKLLLLAVALSLLGLGFAFIERRAPAVPGQVRPPGSIRTDLGHLLITPLLSRFVTAAAIGSGLIGLALITGERWTADAVLEARASSSWVGSWPLAIQLLGLVLLSDLLGYWVHRWYHEHPKLWRLHAIHHSTRAMDWLAAVRTHPLAAGLSRLLHLLPLVLLGF
ncbi:MAG: sterol desaturase family protein, partial [Myxococcales bacterium]|nr:sterol desaturase family protein [Myxococcales bacterium]